jgi:hypothetical protein
MRVVIKCFDMQSGAQIRSRIINWAKPENREWFTRCLTWALHNGAGLQVCNEEDELTEESSQNDNQSLSEAGS